MCIVERKAWDNALTGCSKKGLIRTIKNDDLYSAVPSSAFSRLVIGHWLTFACAIDLPDIVSKAMRLHIVGYSVCPLNGKRIVVCSGAGIICMTTYL